MGLSRILPLIAGVGLVACAGTTDGDLFEPTTAQETSKNEANDAKSGAGVASAPAAADASEPQAKTAAPPPLTPPPPPDGPHPVPPTITCAAEVEPNNDAAHATTFATCIQGSLANSQDDDVVRVVAPTTAQTLIFHHEEGQKVLYRIAQEGNLLPFPPFETQVTDKDVELRIIPGAAYVIHLSFPIGLGGGNNKDPRTWKVNVDFQ